MYSCVFVWTYVCMYEFIKIELRLHEDANLIINEIIVLSALLCISQERKNEHVVSIHTCIHTYINKFTYRYAHIYVYLIINQIVIRKESDISTTLHFPREEE